MSDLYMGDESSKSIELRLKPEIAEALKTVMELKKRIEALEKRVNQLPSNVSTAWKD